MQFWKSNRGKPVRSSDRIFSLGSLSLGVRGRAAGFLFCHPGKLALMDARDLDVFYNEAYGQVFNSGAVGLVSKLAHKSLEAPFGPDDLFENVLELGAGMGQHRGFVRHGFSSYVESDIREEPLLGSSADPRVQRKVLDASSLGGVESGSFDRIIATCLLTHLPNPEAALAEWGRVLAPGGVLSIYLPADPGFLIRLAEMLTTARKTQKRGIDYWAIHLREHRHHFPYLALIVKEVFGPCKVSIRSYPLPGMSWNFSLWFTAQITKDEVR